MDNELYELIREIHYSPPQAVLYITGGGLQALTWLLTVVGASKTVLEARVPYGGTRSMSEILCREPHTFATTKVATELARSAYIQAAQLSNFGKAIVGVSCTCALATERTKKGDHKVCIGIHRGDRTKSYTLQLVKGARARHEEDDVASRLVIKALAQSCNIHSSAESLQLKLLTSASGVPEIVQEDEQGVGEPLQALLEGRLSTVEFSGGHTFCDAPRKKRVYLPGSFNPLHDGHRRLLEAACKLCDQPEDGCFELSIGNPDKGVLPLHDVQRRVQQFVKAGLPVVVTQAPLYVDKARLFSESAFVVGYDTAIRLVASKYYGSHTKMLLELAALRHRGCKFLVAGRAEDSGQFLTLDTMEVPEEIASMGLFEGIPESAFRADISSTELRKAGQGLP